MPVSRQSTASRPWHTAILIPALAMILAPAAMGSLVASCPLSPSGACSPPDDVGDSPGTLLATRIDPFSFAAGGGTTHGAIKTEVFRDSGGTLDFYYIVFNAPDSATPVMGEMEMNFASWALAAAFRSDGSSVPGFVDGNIAPSSATLDATGSIVGFNFSGIPPNQRSRVTIVSTNAPSFTAGTMVVDSSSSLPTFQPTVPEPGTLPL